KLMTDAFAKGALPSDLYRPYLELTLKRGDEDSALQLARNLDPNKFSEDQALDLIEFAHALGNQKIEDALLTSFGTDAYMKDKPALHVIVAMLRKDKDADPLLAETLKMQLTDSERMRLAQSCASAKKMVCFDTLVKQMKPLDQMTPAEVSQYA